MTNAKNTKRALLASVLSMMLCAAMLIGSTFAWFTDSVTSGKNKIVAGNLDVELEYSTNGTDWNPVGTDTNLFKSADETLWEPGHTEYVYLRIRNAGTLALKYQFALNVYGDKNGSPEKIYTSVQTEADGTHKTFKLSNYLVFNQTEDKKEVTKREDLWVANAEEEKAAMGKLDGLGKTNELLPPGAEEILTLAVYMPTQVGNEANQLTSAKEPEGAPTIFVGLNLVAGQAMSEEDSFGKDYDKMAPPVFVSSGTELRQALNKGGNIVLTEDVTLSKYTITRDAEIDLNGHTLKGSATVNTNALAVNGAKLTVKNGTISAPKLKDNVTAAALSVIGDSDVTVENCILKTSSGSDITVVTNGSKSVNSKIVIKNSTISSLRDDGAGSFAAYIPAGDVTFKDCDVTGYVFISGGNVTLDGGTYTATRFGTQEKIYNKGDTLTYARGWTNGNAYSMGDSILIADRRETTDYQLTGLTIQNITFNTEITLKNGSKAVAYAIKYVDMNNNGDNTRVSYVIQNNTFNNKIDDGDPVMFIDIDGNDITNP